jgi:hypothetical protein
MNPHTFRAQTTLLELRGQQALVLAKQRLQTDDDDPDAQVRAHGETLAVPAARQRARPTRQHAPGPIGWRRCAVPFLVIPGAATGSIASTDYQNPRTHPELGP